MATNSPVLVDIGQNLSLMVGLPRITTWKTKERPKKAKQGTFGFNVETNSLEYFNGSDWFAAPLSKSG